MQRAEIKKAIRDRNLTMIGVTYVDLGGVARMKPATSVDIDGVLDDGTKTARANFSLTSTDEMTRDSSLDISQGDLAVVPDLDTFAVPSYTPGVARFMGYLREKDGKTSELCPRNLYARVLERCSSRGYRFMLGFESEFHLVRLDGGRPVRPEMAPVQSQEGFNLHHQFVIDAVNAARSVNVEVVKAHEEGGRSQLEFDVNYKEGLKTADDVVYFKDAVRTVARQHGHIASFMPKVWHDWWGSGMHMHMSLWGSKGENLFVDERDGKKMSLSETAYHFIGGLLAHLEGLSAVSAPSVNSYKRILPGKWNADAAVYGPGARGAAVRIPDERGRATRVECRFPDGTCNPYLAMACILAAGLDGIERKLDPGEPLLFDLSFMSDREIRKKGLTLMPRSLSEALSAFKDDGFFRRTMGDALFDEFLRNRETEVASAADKVTQWEIDNFLDRF